MGKKNEPRKESATDYAERRGRNGVFMLTRDEKLILRTLFQNKIYKADGQVFEDLFTSIMSYAEKDFRQIKPWGNIGDRKNDGYIPSKGIFYQVYAPENIQNNYPEVIKKIKTDFNGLKKQWQTIHEFYFVVNDKYKGVNADSEQAIVKLIKDNGLNKGGFITAKDLENLLFSLNDDQIIMITGSIPDPAKIKVLDYSILNEVIQHIMAIPLQQSEKPTLSLPDWNEKIIFNNLTATTANYLNNGYIQVNSLELYLANNSNFLADELRDKLNEIYLDEKENSSGDELFWKIINKASPRIEQSFQSAAIVILSKYFESCDIFEEPSKEKI